VRSTSIRPAVLVALLAGGGASCVGGPEPAAARWARSWGDRLDGHPQGHSLSCESRAACDLLAAHGIETREDEFLGRLPRSDDPERGFVGDVDGPAGRLPPEGYGVHAPPVAATLREFGLDARAERGRDLAWLRAETTAGRPVLAWTTYACRPGRRVEIALADGRRTAAVRFEHAVLVIGFRDGDVVWLDPASGEVRTASEADFDASWALFDRAAVSARGPAHGVSSTR
jgi:uncharacterized protein YvpB